MRNLTVLIRPKLNIQWITPAVILCLSLLLGWRATPRILIMVAAVVAGATGIGLLWRWPSLGVVGLLAAAMMVPFSLGTGTQTSINAAILGVAGLSGLWLVRMILKREVRFATGLANKPWMALIIVTTLAFIAGNISWNYFAGRASLASQVGGWAMFTFSALAFWLAANEIQSERWLKALVITFLSVSLLYLLGYWVPQVSGITGRFFAAGSVGSVFWIWMAVIPAGQAIFNRDLKLRTRALLVLIPMVSLYSGWRNREWASGWMPAAIGVAALVWLYSWKLGLPATVAGVIIIALWKPEIIGELTQADQYSIFTRGEAAQIILGEVLKVNPVLGLGPSNYYFHTPLYPILGYYVSFNSHSQYVDLIAQTGFIGLGVFTWLAAAIFHQGFQLRGYSRSGFAAGYINACIAGWAGMLVSGFLGDWVIPFVYNIGLNGFRASVLGWLFLGGMMVFNMSQAEQHDGTVY